jgi:uncharacterized repeat protein (TIGR03803 family)
MKMKIAKRTQIKKSPSHRQFKESLRCFHHARTKTNPVQANSPACFPAAVDNGLVRPRNLLAAILFLQGNLISSINTFQVEVAGIVPAEKCRTKEKSLVTTKVEEKKIMKGHIRDWFLLPVLAAGLGLMPAGRLAGQTFTNLHSFTAVVSTTNSDGANPSCSLVFYGNALYGTTEDGGTYGKGTVFAINPGGGNPTNLHVFSATATNGLGVYTNGDGSSPAANLLLSGNTFYGTAEFGGLNGHGTVFSVHPDGTAFTNLYNFSAETTNELGRYTNSDGAAPQCGLVSSGNTLFGTASSGGSSGNGTVFRLNTDGTGFTNLHSFTAYSSGFPSTNSDGYYPQAGVVLSGNALYGTAVYGGAFGKGTVFKVNTDGTVFTNLHTFAATVSSTNGDGAMPFPGLALSGNILYGMATYGGAKGHGTVFAINTDGSGFTNLYNFTGYPLDGQNPLGGLILSGRTLYGMTEFGGSADDGAVFKGSTDGSGFTNLYSFTPPLGTYPNYYNSDGFYPYASLILSGNTLYGTTLEGGTSGFGVVFSLTLPAPPQLTITRSGTNVIVTWPANAAWFALQFTTNLVPPAVWNTNLPVPVVVNGQNTVTNPIAGSQKFFRLTGG